MNTREKLSDIPFSSTASLLLFPASPINLIVSTSNGFKSNNFIGDVIDLPKSILFCFPTNSRCKLDLSNPSKLLSFDFIVIPPFGLESANVATDTLIPTELLFVIV